MELSELTETADFIYRMNPPTSMDFQFFPETYHLFDASKRREMPQISKPQRS